MKIFLGLITLISTRVRWLQVILQDRYLSSSFMKLSEKGYLEVRCQKVSELHAMRARN